MKVINSNGQIIIDHNTNKISNPQSDIKPKETDNTITQSSTYVVKRGDTLSAIAKKLKTTVAELAKLNNITNVNKVAIGQVLKVPNANITPTPQSDIKPEVKPEIKPDKPKETDNTTTKSGTYVVKRGDTLSAIAKKLKTTVAELAKINNITNMNKIAVGQVLKVPGNLTPYQRMLDAKEDLKKIGYGGFTNDRNWDPQFNRTVMDFIYAYGLNEKYYAYKNEGEANNQLFDWIEQAAAGTIQPKINQGLITVKKDLIKIGYTNLLLFDGWSEDYNKALWDFSDKYGCPEAWIQVNLDKEMVYKWIVLAAEGKLLPEDYRGLPKATIDNNYGKESNIRNVCEYRTGKYGNLDDIVNALRGKVEKLKDRNTVSIKLYSSKDQCTYYVEYDYTGVKEGDTFEAKVYRETIDKNGQVKKEKIDDNFLGREYKSFGVLKNGEILANIRFLAELRGVEDIIENKNSIVMNVQDKVEGAVKGIPSLKDAVKGTVEQVKDNEDTAQAPNDEGTGRTYVTKQNLIDIGWNTDQAYLNDDMVKELDSVLVKYGITEPEQIYHFLSQVMKESDNWYKKGFGDGVIELGSDSYISGRYEGRKDLGNTQKGDGILFKGAGYLHLTGRSNYTAFYNYMKSKGVDDLSILSQGYKTVSEKYAWESAAWYWSIARPSLNTTSLKQGTIVTRTVKDDGKMVTVTGNSTVFEVTRLVNGGTNGISDRIKYYNLLKEKIKF